MARRAALLATGFSDIVAIDSGAYMMVGLASESEGDAV